MKKPNLAVIGAGHLGSAHARILSKSDNVRLAGVCDTDLKKAETLARECRCSALADYRDLIGNVDAVTVVVPTSHHYRIAKDFLEHGIHTFIEKPITTSLQEADDLLSLAAKRNLILQVGHVERFNAAIKALQDIKSQVRFIECHRLGPFRARSTDVGVVLDLMIHDIDIILGLVKSRVKDIDAIGVNVLTDKEDIANARIKFEDGTVCNLTASRVTEDIVRKIRIFHTDSYVSIDYVFQSATLYRKSDGKILREEIDIQKTNPLQMELESFVDCVVNGKRPVVSGEEARDALRLALDIVRKIEQAP
jgi:predicted dehydrogenase